MPTKKKGTVKAIPKAKLSAKDMDKVKGGAMRRDSEQCKETSDSGTTGCPG